MSARRVHLHSEHKWRNKMINFEIVMAEFNGPDSEELNLDKIINLSKIIDHDFGNDRLNMIAFEEQ